MKLRIRYKRNPHQNEFHSDISTKLLHLSTGFGGGKSYAAVMKAFQLSQLNPGVSGGLLCPTYAEFKKDMLPLFEMICEENRIKYNYHQTEHYFRFPWSRGRLYVASAEKKLRGPNWGYCVINEVTLIPLMRYREALGRVRDKRSVISQIASVGTPEGTGSEYYEFFIEKPPTDPRLTTRVIYGDTRDNADNLDPSYIPMLEASYDKTMLDAYLRGLWVNMNGNQFYYSYDQKKNEDRSIQHNPNETVHAFMDFNVQFMTVTLWHFDGQRLRGFDEIVIENNASTDTMCRRMKERGYTPERTIIYPDPAGRARKTTGQPDHVVLRNNGYEIRIKGQAPLMRQRQLNTNNLLDKTLIQFNPDAMPTFRRDLQAVEQDPITLEKVKKNPKLTHASDGFDYGCDIIFPFSGKRTETRVVKFR
jgi:hypothetical protein